MEIEPLVQLGNQEFALSIFQIRDIDHKKIALLNCGTKSESYEDVAPTFGEQIFLFIVTVVLFSIRAVCSS